MALLKNEMQKVMNDEGGAPGIDDPCIYDLISIYSNDLGSDYWRQPSFLDTVCNDKKREYIEEWERRAASYLLMSDIQLSVQRASSRTWAV
jgi:hypothetical protein